MNIAVFNDYHSFFNNDIAKCTKLIHSKESFFIMLNSRFEGIIMKVVKFLAFYNKSKNGDIIVFFNLKK